MNAQRTHTMPALGIVAVAGIGIATADLDLDWNTIDGGGGTSSGGSFTLSGTIGQPDAGTMTGGSFELTGGFWGGVRDGSTTPTPCLGDLNGDDVVDTSDLGILLGAFGSSDAGDLNDDGITNTTDLGILLGAFGSGCA